MKWFVSRQCYWGVSEDEQNVVEIAQGGLDYANPDMLVGKYDGEGETYTDPVEAVEASLKIAEQWHKDSPDLTINVAHGCTGGMTMPFEADEQEKLKKWAKETLETLPKCDRCGAVLPEEPYTIAFLNADEKFCSEYCAEERASEYSHEEEIV